MNKDVVQFRGYASQLASNKIMWGVRGVGRVWKKRKKGIPTLLSLLLSMNMTVNAEMPEIVVTPEANEVGGFVFDVRVHSESPTSMYWVVVFVSSNGGGAAPDVFYVEAWHKQQFLMGARVGRSDHSVIPYSLIRNDDNGYYFLLKLSKDVMMNSWGAFRVNKKRAFVIKFKDWYKLNKLVRDVVTGDEVEFDEDERESNAGVP